MIRESYRDPKTRKVKKRTITNFSNCSEEEIQDVKLALSDPAQTIAQADKTTATSEDEIHPSGL